jgi:Family of unknown function (DUF5763)
VKQLAFFITAFIFFFNGVVIGQDVYKTPSGKKYHLATCRMVENVSTKISLPKAIELGLDACKICKPPVAANAIPYSSKKTQGTNTTVQCKGTTKTGTRCKHKTSIANGYCFQHSPD